MRPTLGIGELVVLTTLGRSSHRSLFQHFGSIFCDIRSCQCGTRMRDQPTMVYSSKSWCLCSWNRSEFVWHDCGNRTVPGPRLSMATCEDAHLLALLTLKSLPPHPTVYESHFYCPRLLYSRYESFFIILVLPGTVQRRLGRLHKQDRDEIT